MTERRAGEERDTVDRRASSRTHRGQDPAGKGPMAHDRNVEAEREESAADEPRGDGGGEVTPNLDEALAAEKERADQYYKNWQRSAADFINYKRRIESERGEQSRFASAALVINILPIFDDLDRAVANVDAGLAGLNWVQGVLAIHRKFASLLEAMGVKEVEAHGEQFDPALHEAVARQPGPEGKVLSVVQKGYMLNDRVIRPAMVIVGSGEEPSEERER
jgi:molecular chaperone GrpE